MRNTFGVAALFFFSPLDSGHLTLVFVCLPETAVYLIRLDDKDKLRLRLALSFFNCFPLLPLQPLAEEYFIVFTVCCPLVHFTHSLHSL